MPCRPQLEQLQAVVHRATSNAPSCALQQQQRCLQQSFWGQQRQPQNIRQNTHARKTSATRTLNRIRIEPHPNPHQNTSQVMHNIFAFRQRSRQLRTSRGVARARRCKHEAAASPSSFSTPAQPLHARFRAVSMEGTRGIRPHTGPPASPCAPRSGAPPATKRTPAVPSPTRSRPQLLPSPSRA